MYRFLNLAIMDFYFILNAIFSLTAQSEVCGAFVMPYYFCLSLRQTIVIICTTTRGHSSGNMNIGCVFEQNTTMLTLLWAGQSCTFSDAHKMNTCCMYFVTFLLGFSLGTGTHAVKSEPTGLPEVLLPLYHEDHFWPLTAQTAPQAPAHPTSPAHIRAPDRGALLTGLGSSSSG